MDLSLLTTNAILIFLLILVRITGMLVSAPFFSQTGVPVQVQVGIAVTLSLILFPLLAVHAHPPTENLWQFAWIAAQEFTIGLLIGFVANLLFASVQLAGSHVSTQMGISIAHSVDPVSNEQSPIMGQFYFVIAITLFLSLNIHHHLILATVKSFEHIPVASGLLNITQITGRFMALAGNIFSLSVTMILPLFGIMLVQEIALAFVAKIVPQMNIFMVSLPLKIILALILFSMTLPFTADALINAYDALAKHTIRLYQP